MKHNTWLVMAVGFMLAVFAFMCIVFATQAFAGVYDGTRRDDVVEGTRERDYFFLLAGNDYAHGHRNADELYGDAGNDTLRGGLGADVLWGGPGYDVCIGGRGPDVFDGSCEVVAE